MYRFLVGFFCGISLTLLGGWFFIEWLPSWVTIPFSPREPTPTLTSAAGVSVNLASRLDATEQLNIMIGLSDSVGDPAREIPGGLASLEVTLNRATIELLQADSPRIPEQHRTEILNLTRPTIELFNLRGSGTLAELGTTGLAAGRYANLTFKIDRVLGRLTNGQIRTLAVKESQLTLPGPFDWRDDIQLIIDLDSLRSIEESVGESLLFSFAIRAILQNDTLMSFEETI